jgi:adenylyltransferase/sulfurtransferase
MQTISPTELKAAMQNSDIQLIDVRESYEFEDDSIGGINIPLDEVLSSVDKIDTSKKVVFCCQSGKRSSAIIMTLERKFKLENLHSLLGGVTAFKEA